jgi:hypothetical protein
MLYTAKIDFLVYFKKKLYGRAAYATRISQIGQKIRTPAQSNHCGPPYIGRLKFAI